jgi:hypothetical protein
MIIIVFWFVFPDELLKKSTRGTAWKFKTKLAVPMEHYVLQINVNLKIKCNCFNSKINVSIYRKSKKFFITFSE